MNVTPPSTSREIESSGGSARLGLAVLALALLWIGIFWLTPSGSDEPEPLTITFGDPPQEQQRAPDPAQAGESQAAPPRVEQEANPEPGPSAQPEAPQKPAVIPPEFITYTVQKNDNARTISRKVYGDEGYWRRVMAANPYVDFTRLRAGQEIRVARDPGNIQGVVPGERPEVKPEPVYMEYIVRKNDTLTGIAKEIYGRASLWTRIRDANPGKINSQGTNIRPGMVILIPPPPSQG